MTRNDCNVTLSQRSEVQSNNYNNDRAKFIFVYFPFAPFCLAKSAKRQAACQLSCCLPWLCGSKHLRNFLQAQQRKMESAAAAAAAVAAVKRNGELLGVNKGRGARLPIKRR